MNNTLAGILRKFARAAKDLQTDDIPDQIQFDDLVEQTRKEIIKIVVRAVSEEVV